MLSDKIHSWNKKEIGKKTKCLSWFKHTATKTVPLFQNTQHAQQRKIFVKSKLSKTFQSNFSSDIFRAIDFLDNKIIYTLSAQITLKHHGNVQKVQILAFYLVFKYSSIRDF